MLDWFLSGKIKVRTTWILLIVLVSLPMLLRSARFETMVGDGEGYYAPLRSLFIDHDLNLTNEFQHYKHFHPREPDLNQKTRTGLFPCKYPIGTGVLWIPFFLCAHFIALLLHAIGFPVLANGYTRPYQMAIPAGSVIYGLIGMFLIYKILCNHFTRELSATAVLLITCATNAYYYFVFGSSYSHLCSMFSISLFAWLVIRYHHRISALPAFFIGLSLGLMVIIRNQNAPFGIFLLYEIIDPKERPPVKKYGSLIPFGIAGFALAMIPQVIVWKIIFGSYFAYSYGNESFNFLHPHFLLTLFSTNHGLLLWTPIIAFCLAGLVIFIRKKNPVIGGLAAAMFLLQWCICSTWWCWWFAVSFGQRTMLDISVVFALGLAAFLEKIYAYPRILRSFSFVSLALVAWNMCFIIIYTLYRNHHLFSFLSKYME